MKRKSGKPARPKAPSAESSRLTYRELRNTPGRVWERLANDETLTLVADGEAKGLVIPVHDGDVDAALEAYTRGRAIISLRQIRARARKTGAAKMSMAEINRVIREVRAERRAKGERS